MDQLNVHINNQIIPVTSKSIRNLISKIPDIEIACHTIAAENGVSFGDMNLSQICSDFLWEDDTIYDAIQEVSLPVEVYFAHIGSETKIVEFDEWNDDEIHICAVIAALLYHAFATIEDISVTAQVYIDIESNNIDIAMEKKNIWQMNDTEKETTKEDFENLIVKWTEFLSDKNV